MYEQLLRYIRNDQGMHASVQEIVQTVVSARRSLLLSFNRTKTFVELP